MTIPRTHWHLYVGHPVLVHCTTGVYHGHLHSVSNTHLILHGYRLATAESSETGDLTTLDEAAPATFEHVYYPAAALALPLTAIVAVTALGLGAMALW